VSQKRRVLTPAHPAHPGWRVSRSHARKSKIFPPGTQRTWVAVMVETKPGTRRFTSLTLLCAYNNDVAQAVTQPFEATGEHPDGGC